MGQKLETTIKEYAEEMAVDILLNTEPYYKDSQGGYCHHAQNGVVPRIIKAFNEGGYNSTEVCLDCLLEWVDAHRYELGYEQDGAK